MTWSEPNVAAVSLSSFFFFNFLVLVVGVTGGLLLSAQLPVLYKAFMFL